MGAFGISVGAGDRPARGRVRLGLLRATRYVCAHWLFGANLALLVYCTLPVAAPILADLGAGSVSRRIFKAYGLVCNQKPSRSYTILGRQAAYCERCTAIYVSAALAGLAYVRLRPRRIRPLPWRWYVVLALPLAIDASTQFFGRRESTRLRRGVTGTTFGLATSWLAFPTLQESFDRLAGEIDGELEGIG